MREDADVHTLGGANQPIKIVAEGPLPPALAALAVHINLGNSALTREAKYGVDGIVSIEHDDFGAFLPGQIDGLLDAFALVGRPIWTVQVRGDQLAVKAIAI